MSENGFGINNLQWLRCHKTKPNLTKHIIFGNYYNYMSSYIIIIIIVVVVVVVISVI